MAAALSITSPAGDRDVLWEHCRNNLGIARLLVHEARPAYLVATACRMAVESAARAALEQEGGHFDGDLGRAFDRLGAPAGLAEIDTLGVPAAERLAAAERAVAWVAAWLRPKAPERTWGF